MCPPLHCPFDGVYPEHNRRAQGWPPRNRGRGKGEGEQRNLVTTFHGAFIPQPTPCQESRSPSRRGAIDADELAGKLGLRLDGGVNSVGLAYKIRIECTDDDASVVWVQSMQIDEVLPLRVSRDRVPAEAEASTSSSGTDCPAWPVSWLVSTSCPNRRSSMTTGSGKFSFA
jgi:hypothetical protein